MGLSDRIRQIILENNLKQKEFASSINVTESFISKLLRGESGVSSSTAALIEEKYGYRAEWILWGQAPQKTLKPDKSLTPLQKKLILEIEKMEDAELIAVKAFVDSLQEYRHALGIEP